MLSILLTRSQTPKLWGRSTLSSRRKSPASQWWRLVTILRNTSFADEPGRAMPEGPNRAMPEGPHRAMPEGPHRGIPDATVARLPVYLRALSTLIDQGVATCSSNELAEQAGVNPAKLRKDLSYLGSYGTRGVGYEVEYLRYQIAREIGQTQDWDVVIVGVGNLGSALSAYQGFSSRGIRVAALVDSDPARVGEVVSGITVTSLDDLD